MDKKKDISSISNLLAIWGKLLSLRIYNFRIWTLKWKAIPKIHHLILIFWLESYLPGRRNSSALNLSQSKRLFIWIQSKAYCAAVKMKLTWTANAFLNISKSWWCSSILSSCSCVGLWMIVWCVKALYIDSG